jgi:torulene dioxygenase
MTEKYHQHHLPTQTAPTEPATMTSATSRIASSASLGLENAPEIHTPVQLAVTGKIPAYVRGALYRTGPGTFRLKAHGAPGEDDAAAPSINVHHWFDGPGMTHRFGVQGGADPKVTYRCSKTARGLEKLVESQGGWGKMGSFGQRPDACAAYFSDVESTFEFDPSAPDAGNVAVTVGPLTPGMARVFGDAARSQSGGTILSRTDVNRLQLLDAETAKPLALAPEGYGVLDPALAGRSSAAHPCVDARTGDTINFVLNFTPKPTYTVFCVPAEGEVRVLAKVEDAPPAYLHSLWMTEKYVILCVWQADMMG